MSSVHARYDSNEHRRLDLVAPRSRRLRALDPRRARPRRRRGRSSPPKGLGDERDPRAAPLDRAAAHVDRLRIAAVRAHDDLETDAHVRRRVGPARRSRA